jgi:autotransporter-associated beta strand protein
VKKEHEERKMSRACSGGPRRRRYHAIFAAASAVLAAEYRIGDAQVTLNQISNSDWTINNGPLQVVFNPSSEDITNIKFINDGTTSPNLLNSSSSELDQEFAGTPFGSGPETFNYQMGPSNSYIDVWTNVASNGTVNPISYAFHYVLFANDPTIQVYEVLNHASTDPATSVGQGQFLFRGNQSYFTNLYQTNTGPNNLGPQTSTSPIPSTTSGFATATGNSVRQVQNVTYDLSGTGVSGDEGYSSPTNFFTKYDYSIYNQFYQAETMYGNQYAVSAIVPSTETMTGGPTKQELAWTDPDILNLEFLSDHYGIDGNGTGSYPGYAYYPTQGQNTTRLFGPYAFQISSTTSTTAAQINQNAINDIPNLETEAVQDTELVSSGYLPMNTNARGSVQLNLPSSAGWSSNTTNNTAVLSEPGVNMQESTQGYQYWTQLSQTGTGTVNNVAPGYYRMTLYQLGQWGETRVDGVETVGGQTTIPQNVKFTPENFSNYAPIWTIGTPNRSANEFQNGHNSTGGDLREYYGAYDYWAEEQALGTPGYVSYNATATVINGVAEPATNNPNDWLANQWQTFDPPEYDSANNSTDEYSKTTPSYVTAGGGPANYHGAPWQVHFETNSAQDAQGQYVVLSVAVVALDASLVVTLNGHSETWSYNNFSPDDPMIRSGDAGFYQWAAFQFPESDLNAPGTDNEVTFGVSSHTDGVMYDAIRMEITNTSAAPSTTGWYDYTYINGSSSTAPVDSNAIDILNWDNAGQSGDGMTWDNNFSTNWNDGVSALRFTANSNVVFNDNNNGHYDVTLNSVVSPGSVTVNNSSGNYVIDGSGEIAGSGSLFKSGTGTLTLITQNIYTGGTTVNQGALIVGMPGSLPSNSSLALTGGNAVLAPDIGQVTLSSLSISGNSTLDIGNNHVIINYGASDPMATIYSYLKSGSLGGPGIISSFTATPTNGFNYGVGFADGADGIVSGLSSGQIEIKYTLLGDANLDGIVNGSDFSILAANFGQGYTNWDQGNFLFTPTINGADFAALAANFGQGDSGADGAVTAADFAALDEFAAINGLLADVPEPASTSVLAAMAVGCLRRRRSQARSNR